MWGKRCLQLALTHFGLGQQSNHIGKIAKVIQKISVKLLGINDVKNSALTFKILQFLIDGFVKKFFPSFEFLLGLFCVFLHFLLLHGSVKEPGLNRKVQFNFLLDYITNFLLCVKTVITTLCSGFLKDLTIGEKVADKSTTCVK